MEESQILQEGKLCACWAPKGYKGPDDEDGAENVILEGEQSQTHVGEDEILSQEVKDFKELQGKYNIHHEFNLEMYECTEKIWIKIHRKSLQLFRFNKGVS